MATRINSSNIMENDSRRTIYTMASQDPPVTRREVERETGLSAASVADHIHKLESNGLLLKERMPGGEIYYAPGTLETSDLHAYFVGSSDTKRRTFRCIAEEDPQSQKEVAENIDVSTATVKHHIGKIEERGLIRIIDDGRSKRPVLTEDGVETYEKMSLADAD